MAKESDSPLTDQQMLNTFLKSNKDHFQFMEARYWRISTGSLLLDSTIGYVTPGVHRFVGQNSGGKTSEALEVMRNFLASVKPSKGVFFNAEHRLGDELKERCGLKFVTKPEDWVTGTVFVFDTNCYETVAEFIQKLILNASSENYYGIIIDSIDALGLKNDLAKGFDEASKVAGGAVIASLLLKRIAAPLTKRGHFLIPISQVRSDIKLDQYAPKEIRQISGTGGNALLHYANLILDFQPRFKGDLIVTKEGEAPSSSNPLLGHWAKIIVRKSSNETLNYLIKYPIKYGVKGGSSIWVVRELVDSLVQWEEVEKRGSWYSFSGDIQQVLNKGGVTDIPASIQGMDGIFAWLDSNPIAVKALFDHFKQVNAGGLSVSEIT